MALKGYSGAWGKLIYEKTRPQRKYPVRLPLRVADLKCILCSDGYPPESGKINWLHLWPDENLLD
jgi:hypothetical protein